MPRVRPCKSALVEFAFDPIVLLRNSSCPEVFERMEQHPSGLKPESWLVPAGRASEPGSPLNVPPIPASNFVIGGGREYSRRLFVEPFFLSRTN